VTQRFARCGDFTQPVRAVKSQQVPGAAHGRRPTIGRIWPAGRAGVVNAGAAGGHAHQAGRDTETLGDAFHHVVGHDPAAVDDRRHLGLGLVGQRAESSLAVADLLQIPEKRGEVPAGQRGLCLGPLPMLRRRASPGPAGLDDVGHRDGHLHDRDGGRPGSASQQGCERPGADGWRYLRALTARGRSGTGRPVPPTRSAAPAIYRAPRPATTQTSTETLEYGPFRAVLIATRMALLASPPLVRSMTKP
jgi:hypothetical protein